jgi:hypothetical protein
MPEIKLPKRTPKSGGSEHEVKMTLASVDGTLRKMGEKDLYLQTGPQRFLRFRLLAKTKFQNKEGEPIRDSLLHPGDQLSLQVNTDDEETALRVTLLRTATDAERSAAELPFDQSLARAPRAEDMGKPKTVAVQETVAAADSESTPEPAKTEGAAPAAESASTPAPSSPSASSPAPPVMNKYPVNASDEQIIRDARTEADNYSSGLPNFLVQQVTSRYFSSGLFAQWQPIDEVTADVAYVDGKEDYRNVKINGVPADRPIERTGAWSTGEWSTTLEDVLSPATNAAFKRRGEVAMVGRRAVVYDYKVEQPNSHWSLISPDGRKYNPAYEGAIWIDKETRRVLRIEQKTTFIPREFPFSKCESTLEYAFVQIEKGTYLLPVGSENKGCMSGSGTCTRNAIAFRNYRKFEVGSQVKW